MSKYQKAVNNIVTYYGLLNVTKGHYQELADTLQELVDKATPKKPKDILNSTWVECPNCGDIKIDKFCPNCGQAIDWSEND